MKYLYLGSLSLLLLLIASCSKETGTVKVTYTESTPIYGNMEDVRNVPLNGEVRTVVDPGKIYIGDNFILLGEENKGIHVIDNSNPDNPSFTNFIEIPGNREFIVDGNFLFGETYYDVVKVDISDPNNASLIARAENVLQQDFKNDQGETLLGFDFHEVSSEVDIDSDLYSEIQSYGRVYRDYLENIIPRSAVPSSFAGNSNEQGGTVNRFAYSNNHVYLVGMRKMHVIRDEGMSLSKVATEFLGDDTETIFPYEDKLFLGSRASMTILDASNPQDVSIDYTFEHATSCDPVLPLDDVAYISLRTANFTPCPGNINALIVLDISDLERPKELGEIEMASPYGMTAKGEQLFVGEGENGLKIFDISNPFEPELTMSDESVEAYDVIAHPVQQNLLLIAGPNGLEQYQLDADFELNLKSRISY